MTSLKSKRFVDTDYLQENVIEKLEILENVSERNNMEYSTDNGIVHCKDTIKGRVNDLAIEGNTMVNYCTDGSKTLTLNGDINEVGTHITTTNAVNNGLVDVMCEGETLVNVCNQKDPIAITKSYTVENTNHVPLQGEYDGKARPVVEGNTLVNLAPKYSIKWTHSGTWLSTFLIGRNNANNTYPRVLQDLKPNTEYTVVVNIKTNTQSGNINLNNYQQNTCVFKDSMYIKPSDIGVKTFKVKTVESFDHINPPDMVVLRSQSAGIASGKTVIEDIMIFEGDLTANPPSGYIEGLKSSFEDQLIPKDVIRDLGLTPNLTQGEGITFEDGLFTVPDKNKAVSFTHSTFGKKHTMVVYPTDNSSVYVVHSLNNGTNIQVWQDNTGTKAFLMDNANSNTYRMYPTSSGTSSYHIVILEGDYTSNPPTYEEVTNHSGKYKVEYKVTGKNKFNIKDSNYATNRCSMALSDNKITLTSSASSDNNGFVTWNLPKLIDGKSYTIRFKGEGVKDTNEPWVQVVDKDSNHYNQYNLDTLTFVANGQMLLRFYCSVRSNSGKSVSYWDIQIEEGTTATTYEEYKEYTKTFYLNSPLLEGDTIEDVNGKATHVKRYAKTILDGSENWIGQTSIEGFYRCATTKLISTTSKEDMNGICDRFRTVSSVGANTKNHECMMSTGDGGYHFVISSSKLSTQDVGGFKKWLQSNPTTVVYKLASPVYEKISEESILTDSYVNGHLDLDTNVTVNKVGFKNTSFNLAYMQPSTPYTIQFTSDNIGIVEMHGGDRITTINVVKGINKVVINSRDNGNTYWNWTGIGFNASNISVVATEREFDYFEGLSSVGQDNENGHNIEILSQNKNLLDLNRFTVSLNKGSMSINNNIITFNYRSSYPTIKIVFTPYEIRRLEGKTFSFSYDNITDTNVVNNRNIRFVAKVNGKFQYLGVGTSFATLPYNIEELEFSIVPNNSGAEREGTFTITNPQLEIGETSSDYVPFANNTKSIPLNEPLRSLPNGVKDRFVKIGQKWYIERNCVEVVLDGSDDESWGAYANIVHEDSTCIAIEMPKKMKTNRNEYATLICDKLCYFDAGFSQNTTNISTYVSDIYNNNHIYLRVMNTQLSSNDKLGVVRWLKNNPITVVYPLATPVYEELTVDPTLTTYVDCTHISTNSVIPCDMKVKNSGYSTIIKPSTLYTVALDTNKSGEVKVNLGGAEKTTTNNIVTLTTPSTLVDDSLRISGKGLKSKNVRLLEGDKTNFIPSYFEGLKSSFEEKQGDNHIVEVISNNKNLIEWEDLSLYTPQKNAKVEKTTEGIRAYNRVSGEDRVFLQPFRVRQGSKVTISFDVKVDTEGSSTLFYLSFLDANFNVIANNLCFPTKIYTTSFERLTKTFDVGNANYIRIELVCFGTSAGATYKNIMVTESSSSYTPRETNKIQFSTLAPLRSVGDISDKLVYKDNKWMIERNCGEVTITSENFAPTSARTQGNMICAGYYFPNQDVFNTNNLQRSLSNRLICKSISNIYNDFQRGYAINNSKWIYITLHESELDSFDVEGMKKWVDETPLHIVYQLAEPYYEEIGQYRNLDSYDEGTTIYANTLIAPKNLSFNLATHMSNIVKDVQDDVSDLKTWRSEVFDSITHKKTFDSGITTIEDTKEGVIDEVKIQGKTLTTVFTCSTNRDYSKWQQVDSVSYKAVEVGKVYTLIATLKDTVQCGLKNKESNDYLYPFKTSTGAYICSTITFSKEEELMIVTDVAGKVNIEVMILEGDHTQNPPSYFEGLKSVGEDVDEIEVLSNGDLYNIEVASVHKDTNKIQQHLKNYIYEDFFVYNPYTSKLSIVVFKNGSWVKDILVGKGCSKIVLNEGEYVNYINQYFANGWNENDKDKLANINMSFKQDKKQILYYNNETQTWEKPILRQWDSIEKHTDGKYYYHQRSGQVVFMGNEFWELRPQSDSQDIISFNGSGLTTSSNVLGVVCDKFPTIEAFGEGANFENIFIATSTRMQIRVLKSKLSTQDVNGFKQWLSQNPVTVVYQLAQEKVYECTNIELNSYDGETNVIVESNISPITTVSLTSNLPQVAENLKNRVRHLEDEVYNYRVSQNLRQLRTFYRSDYANFGVSIVNDFALNPTEVTITPYALDLFEIFKEVIAQGKDKYDRIELEEYIDFYLMTFVFDFDMVFELFDLLDANEDIIEDEPVEEEPPMEEEEEIVEDTPTILPLLPEDEEVVEDTPTILPILPEDEATIIPLI